MLTYSFLLGFFSETVLGREHSGKVSKKIHQQLLVLRYHLKLSFALTSLRAKCDIQDQRFRISSAALLRQVRLCFAGTGLGRGILNSNPADRLDEHPLYFTTCG